MSLFSLTPSINSGYRGGGWRLSKYNPKNTVNSISSFNPISRKEVLSWHNF